MLGKKNSNIIERFCSQRSADCLTRCPTRHLDIRVNFFFEPQLNSRFGDVFIHKGYSSANTFLFWECRLTIRLYIIVR